EERGHAEATTEGRKAKGDGGGEGRGGKGYQGLDPRHEYSSSDGKGQVLLFGNAKWEGLGGADGDGGSREEAAEGKGVGGGDGNGGSREETEERKSDPCLTKGSAQGGVASELTFRLEGVIALP
ncbi:hypothetical protein AMTR_s00086p00060660, partial [Amborella trichopoda]